MKNECSIVCDLLPLYAEDMVSEDTAEFVKEHLGNCPTCRAELEKLRKPVQPVAAQHVPDIDAEPLKRLKKALLMEKVQAILCTAAVLLALMLSGLSFLTAPEYFAYSQELVTVTEGANGEATISFSSEITNYKLQRIADPADKQTVYHLEVWTCAWDRMFSKPGAHDVTVKPENGHELLIYFTQFINQSSSNSAVCIYGEIEPDSGGWMALPGLSMVGDKHSPACDPRCNMAESAQKGEAAPSGRTADSDSHRLHAWTSLCAGLSHSLLLGMA